MSVSVVTIAGMRNRGGIFFARIAACGCNLLSKKSFERWRPISRLPFARLHDHRFFNSAARASRPASSHLFEKVRALVATTKPCAVSPEASPAGPNVDRHVEHISPRKSHQLALEAAQHPERCSRTIVWGGGGKAI